jgi:hypothetical protein
MPDAEPVEACELGNEMIRKLENAGRRAESKRADWGRMAGLYTATPRLLAKEL